MRLCSFEVATSVGRFQRLGAVAGSQIIDLNFACAALLHEAGEPRPQMIADATLPASMRGFLEAGRRAHESALEVLESELPLRGPNDEQLIYSVDQVRLLAPLPNPASVRDFYAFEQHVKTGFAKRGEPMPEEWYQMPVYYKSGHHNIVGPDADVAWPSFTEKFDYELELACIIGRRGRNVSGADAAAYIAGYTIMNDFSARDVQRREMKVRLGPAKGKDWATALGPVLVTADELANPYVLNMEARINGEQWSQGNSALMFWRFEQMIEFLTLDDEILPGDVIGSGTVGTGCGLELDRWVQRGDVMELEIEKIGVLRNRVV